MNKLFVSLRYYLDRKFAERVLPPFAGQHAFSALIELQSDFGSGNDLHHNTHTNTVHRGPEYHKYKDELIEQLDDVQEKVKAQFSKNDELAVSLVFYQTNTTQNKRSTKDLDNMEKPTLDAMQVVLGFDDAQIIQKLSQKQTGFSRSLRIDIWKL
jgi:Holliday junction resolvase RusA-like endonuclease